MANTGTNKPLAIQMYRPKNAGSWILRLTTKKPFLRESEKIIHLSATAVPERLRLMYGTPTKSSTWLVYKATLAKKENRIVVADRSYSRAGIFAGKADDLRRELLETVDKLIETERARTKLPVAVIGASRVMNWYLEHRLGREARNYAMPWKGSERADKMAELKAVTLPLGFICGYAHGVAGSNDFAIEQAGIKRFVRSLIVMGNIVPNLAEVARDHRGLHVGVRDEPVDWTPTFRVVPFEGMVKDGQALVAKNVVGYRDNVANAVLHGIYQGELLQVIGRMRGQLVDPLDPTLVPTVYMFASVAIEGFEVDEVITMDDLRRRLALEVRSSSPIGRPAKRSLEDQIRARWSKCGAKATMLWLVKGLFPSDGDMAVTHARLAIQSAGLEPGGAVISAAVQLVRELAAKTAS